MRFCWYGVEGGKKPFRCGSEKNFYEIITTGKLMVCTAPKRGHYRHSPCKGHRIIVSHHTHCRP